MHIAIEGMDAVGKTSVAKLLSKKLGFEFLPKSFHAMVNSNIEYDNFIKIKDYPDFKDKDKVYDCSYGFRGAFLYNKLHLKNVISDRYYVCNFWANSKGEDLIEFKNIIDLFGIPDYTFLLYTDMKTAHQRMLSRNINDKDLYKIQFMPEAYRVMEKFIAHNSLRHVMIDTTNLSIEQVSEVIISIIKNSDYILRCDKEYCKIIDSDKEFINIKDESGEFIVADKEIKKFVGNVFEIKIPEDIESIANYAFSENHQLKTIFISNSIRYIGDWTFIGCNELENIFVSKSNEYYKDMDGNLYTKDGQTLVQYSIGKKEKIFNVPANVKYIGARAFSCCKNLEQIILPNNIEQIGFAAFQSCINLKEINIPSSVNRIGYNAFLTCMNLSNIVVDKNNNYYTSDSNLYNKDKSAIIRYCPNKEGGYISLDTKVLKPWSFSDVSNIKSIKLTNEVNEIGSYAFYNSSVENIEISENVIQIGERAFFGCKFLKNIKIKSKKPPKIGKEMISETNTNLVIYVPKGTKEIYMLNKKWSELNCIIDEYIEEDDI